MSRDLDVALYPGQFQVAICFVEFPTLIAQDQIDLTGKQRVIQFLMIPVHDLHLYIRILTRKGRHRVLKL